MSLPLIRKIRQRLAALLLRGSLLDWWLARKVVRLVDAYHQQLLRAVSPKRVEPLPAMGVGVTKLRHLLFITDVYWEKRELLPELSRICEVTFVDMHHRLSPDASGFLHLPPDQAIAELSSHRGTRFDAVIVYLQSAYQSIELLDFIRVTWKCPLLGLNLDCKVNYANYGLFQGRGGGYEDWAGAFDCNLTNALAMVDVYRAANFPCLYLPTGFHFDPQQCVRPVRAEYDYSLSFVGSRKPERQAVIEQLQKKGIDVQVFGGGWEGRPFMNDAWKVFHRSQINMGIGYNVPAQRITNLKNRDFECPGSGGCYLTNYDWELAGLYEIGREILCYRDLDEFVELYSHYIRRPEECLKIAQAGFDRCVREHTWEHRFRKVFGELGLI